MEWSQLCRLCGSQSGNGINIFIKNEIFSIAQTIQRFFPIVINSDEVSKCICTLCNEFLVSLISFSDRALKVQQLFLEIECNLKDGTQIDLNELRLKYSLEIPILIEPNLIDDSVNSKKNEEEIFNQLQNSVESESDPIESSDSAPILSRKRQKTSKKTVKKNTDDKVKKKKISNKSVVKAIQDENSGFDDFEDDNSYPEYAENNSDNDEKKDILPHEIKLENLDTSEPIEDKPKPLIKKKIYKTGEKNFECEECHQKFTRESNYIYHIKKSHKGLPPCEFCGKVCKTKQKLRLHLELHLPPEEREKLLFKCTHCEKKFTQSAKVKEHVRAIHLLEKPFVCEQCGKNFASQSNLCSHKRTHDDKSRLHCNLCPKIFNNPHKLRFHIKHTHNSTGHPCSVCGHVLKTRKTLRNHMLIHSDEKPFKCNFCGKDFKRDKNLQIHMITHSGLKPFSCRFCGQSYANRSNCKKHEKHSHPIEYEAAAAVISTEPQQQIVKKLPNIQQLEAMLEQMKADKESTSNGVSNY